MKINEVIVVEGQNDTKKLKMFFECDTIETHGLGLNKETLEYIKLMQEKRGVILFLDPDSPGEKIRNTINSYVKGCKNAFIDKTKARTSKKVGVEHASFEDLKESLDNLMTYGDVMDKSISYEEFIDLGLNGANEAKLKRDYLGKVFHIGLSNAKTLYKRLNLLGLTYDDVKKELDKL